MVPASTRSGPARAGKRPTQHARPPISSHRTIELFRLTPPHLRHTRLIARAPFSGCFMTMIARHSKLRPTGTAASPERRTALTVCRLCTIKPGHMAPVSFADRKRKSFRATTLTWRSHPPPAVCVSVDSDIGNGSRFSTRTCRRTDNFTWQVGEASAKKQSRPNRGSDSHGSATSARLCRNSISRSVAVSQPFLPRYLGSPQDPLE